MPPREVLPASRRCPACSRLAVGGTHSPNISRTILEADVEQAVGAALVAPLLGFLPRLPLQAMQRPQIVCRWAGSGEAVTGRARDPHSSSEATMTTPTSASLTRKHRHRRCHIPPQPHGHHGRLQAGEDRHRYTQLLVASGARMLTKAPLPSYLQHCSTEATSAHLVSHLVGLVSDCRKGA